MVVQFPDWFVAQIMGGSGLLIVPSRRGWSVLLLGGGFSFKDLLPVLKYCLIIRSLCFFLLPFYSRDMNVENKILTSS